MFYTGIGGTSACTNKTRKATKGCGKLSSNVTLFTGSWFGGVGGYLRDIHIQLDIHMTLFNFITKFSYIKSEKVL